jgi:cytochrome b6-f complex iron-sulfur subunit
MVGKADEKRSSTMKEPIEQRKSRRSFLNYLLATSLGATILAILYPIMKFVIPPTVAEATQTNVVAGKVDELKPNSGKIFKFGSKPGIVIETPGGKIRAFTAICTHLECTVQYREDLQHIWCACHNGHYDLSGKNIAGPPPRPLEEYAVNIRGEEIIVSKQ